MITVFLVHLMLAIVNASNLLSCLPRELYPGLFFIDKRFSFRDYASCKCTSKLLNHLFTNLILPDSAFQEFVKHILETDQKEIIYVKDSTAMKRLFEMVLKKSHTVFKQSGMINRAALVDAVLSGPLEFIQCTLTSNKKSLRFFGVFSDWRIVTMKYCRQRSSNFDIYTVKPFLLQLFGSDKMSAEYYLSALGNNVYSPYLKAILCFMPKIFVVDLIIHAAKSSKLNLLEDALVEPPSWADLILRENFYAEVNDECHDRLMLFFSGETFFQIFLYSTPFTVYSQQLPTVVSQNLNQERVCKVHQIIGNFIMRHTSNMNSLLEIPSWVPLMIDMSIYK